ncbi:glycoside hydrolase family 38 C-terminal domain-containing protein [Synechococcus sp. LA31]|uniref:alpha-mannosidase n=1 Tax=Synechococcus sp. LA31 TaxID=2741953 RepID=UPI001BDC276B|nr:glycoside hydrolase family 38 C-terminal domain-containing protein [Synechococcus sp. LA31]QVV66875.1 alpha-mannosidase [Synechococcus sp. LA31]
MPEGPEGAVRTWIETFQGQVRLDLRPQWRLASPGGAGDLALLDPWGAAHRPDWHARGLLIWPRGGRWLSLQLDVLCPVAWQQRQQGDRLARLVLRWWADAVELRVNGALVHQGDLFDTACRWPLPASWWQGQPLQLELRLRSPLHDDGALITSAVEQEPVEASDPTRVLTAPQLAMAAERLNASALQQLHARLERLDPADPASAAALQPWLEQQVADRPPGVVHVLGHAHLDLAWLWPVADTWQAALRTFESALALMQRYPALHFAHSTPALYAWIEQHRPALFARLRQAMRDGRFEPVNGPWVESDCVLIGTASLLQQFALGQAYSRSRFPEWRHHLCWLPDSFGFSAGLPAVARSTGVTWFCTHKLAWNSSQPFPHRLFRWRGRCGAELMALSTAPIGTDGDPLAIDRYSRQWQAATGVEQALWLPGVGDHGGGPTAEMLEQLQLWEQQPLASPQRHGTLRAYLEELEPLRRRLPVWRDELYLELHRGCATSRPDQKRHNRSLERLLREADLAQALQRMLQPTVAAEPGVDWRPLLFQQFHDILPGTSIPEVFEQAEPQWRQARRQAARCRDQALQALLAPHSGWWLVQLQLQAAGLHTLRLPPGHWQAGAVGLPHQPAPGGGTWVQLAMPAGLAAVPLHRSDAALAAPAGVQQSVQLEIGEERWWLSNGLLRAEFGPGGLQQLWGGDGVAQLRGPLAWCRWGDHGEFWDAWDIAADYRSKPLPLQWQPGPDLAEQGPLCTRLVWRGRCGNSSLRLDVQLRAASPWLELCLRVDWQQRHELLRLELPLAQAACRYAADTPGGVLERPAAVMNAREQARWEVPAISWLASQASAGGGLAVLLDGPQGVSADADRLGVSLLRAPTWPDPSADQGLQRIRLALMPCADGWREQAVPRQAQRFREPLWLRPAAQAEGTEVPLPLDLGSDALQLVQLQPLAQPGEAQLVLQNLSPQRQCLRWPEGWRARREGLGDGAFADAQEADGDLLRPWQLGRWRVSGGAELSQSS